MYDVNRVHQTFQSYRASEVQILKVGSLPRLWISSGSPQRRQSLKKLPWKTYDTDNAIVRGVLFWLVCSGKTSLNIPVFTDDGFELNMHEIQLILTKEM